MQARRPRAVRYGIEKIKGRKLVFTNASTAHAERVLRRLGIHHHFHDVFDIVAAGIRPKPEPEIYRTLVERHVIEPRRAVMVEDMARNLMPAAALGMTTVWVRTGSDLGAFGAEGAHIHYVVDDLATWPVAEGSF